MSKIICICGKAQNGKDTTANLIKEIAESRGNRVLIIHFADMLKFICKSYVGWDGNKDENGRKLLQEFGSKLRKSVGDSFDNYNNERYFVDIVSGIIRCVRDRYDYILIPDTRYINEYETLKSRYNGVSIIRVSRPGFDNGLSDEQKKHPSETELDGYRYNWVIDNSGTVDDLKRSVENMIRANII